MKTNAFLLLFLPLILSMSPIFSTDDYSVEIKDREHLPVEVYQALKNYDAILIGEVHGNNETPEFVEGMINLWLASGEKVILGLEINQDEQENLDKFIQSGDVELLKKSPFFNRPFQDGRSSAAMAHLIQMLRIKNDLKIVCLDVPSAQSSSPKRDSVMAMNAIAAVKSYPGRKLITLTGNVHNKTELGGFGYPMGYWLSNNNAVKINKEKVISVDVVYEGGNSWNCQGREVSCRVYEQGNLSRELATKYSFENGFIQSGDERFFFTRKISASLPLNK